MARGTLTIYDVPGEVRAKGAAQARMQVHVLLSNPHLTSEQREDLLARLVWISKWESANVGEVLPPPVEPEVEPVTPRLPQHHSVEVVEVLAVDDDM